MNNYTTEQRVLMIVRNRKAMSEDEFIALVRYQFADLTHTQAAPEPQYGGALMGTPLTHKEVASGTAPSQPPEASDDALHEFAVWLTSIEPDGTDQLALDRYTKKAVPALRELIAAALTAERQAHASLHMDVLDYGQRIATLTAERDGFKSDYFRIFQKWNDAMAKLAAAESTRDAVIAEARLDGAKAINKYYAGVERPNHGATCSCKNCEYFAALEGKLK